MPRNDLTGFVFQPPKVEKGIKPRARFSDAPIDPYHFGALKEVYDSFFLPLPKGMKSKSLRHNLYQHSKRDHWKKEGKVFRIGMEVKEGKDGFRIWLIADKDHPLEKKHVDHAE